MFEPPRYMTVAVAATQLMEGLAQRESDGRPAKSESCSSHSFLPSGFSVIFHFFPCSLPPSLSSLSSFSLSPPLFPPSLWPFLPPSLPPFLPPTLPPSLAVLSGDTLCVGVARVGSDSQAISHSPLKDMVTMEMGGPLQSLVITGKLHPLEERMLQIASTNS